MHKKRLRTFPLILSNLEESAQDTCDVTLEETMALCLITAFLHCSGSKRHSGSYTAATTTTMLPKCHKFVPVYAKSGGLDKDQGLANSSLNSTEA